VARTSTFLIALLLVSLVANAALFGAFMGMKSSYDYLFNQKEYYKERSMELEEQLKNLNASIEMYKHNAEVYKKEYEQLSRDYRDLESKYYSLYQELSEYKRLENNYKAYYSDISRYFFLEDFLKNILTEEQEKALKPYVSKTVSDPKALSTSLKEITTFVSEHVKYAADPPMIIPPSPEVAKLSTYVPRDAPNLFQLPSETLKRGYGDCDDINSLLYAMIKVYLKDFYGENYVLYLAVATRRSGEGHLFVILPIKGGKMVVLDASGSAYWSGVEVFGERFMFSGYIREAWSDYLEETGLEKFDDVRIYRLEFYGFVKKEFEGSIEEMLNWLEETTK